jgi:cytochrome bd-type quinol oxidase subunit 2
MLMPNVILALLLLTPLALTFLLKSNAALSFLALCAGFVLSTSVIGDLKQLLSQINLSTTDSTLALVILIAPPVITLLLTRKSSVHKAFFWLQLLAALGVGGLLALAVAPVISESSNLNITSSKFWEDLQKGQSAIIGVGALISLIVVWLTHLKHPKDKKHII